MHPAKPSYARAKEIFLFVLILFHQKVSPKKEEKEKKMKRKIRRILVERKRLAPRFACIRKIVAGNGLVLEARTIRSKGVARAQLERITVTTPSRKQTCKVSRIFATRL